MYFPWVSCSGVVVMIICKLASHYICSVVYLHLGSQGPAELRRLLTWASTRRHGGIIIIDEAESALGSRAKTKSDDSQESDGTSSSSYSRDCLNVLLSMTGSFGNIMLILTTSNPCELDEAVLDRLDEIIHLPLPNAECRKDLLTNQFARQFEQQHVEDERPSLMNQYLLPKLCRSSTTKAMVDRHFDIEGYILVLTTKTKGFSGRELEKLIQGILYKTYSSDSGILCGELWRKEVETLLAAFRNKHLLVAT